MLDERIPKVKNSKIDMKQLRDFHSTDPYFIKADGKDIAFKMDEVKECQSILSKELPPERYNGIINLIYIFNNPKATSEEIEYTLVNMHDSIELLLLLFF